jgi:hypothetical protein
MTPGNHLDVTIALGLAQESSGWTLLCSGYLVLCSSKAQSQRPQILRVDYHLRAVWPWICALHLCASVLPSTKRGLTLSNA